MISDTGESDIYDLKKKLVVRDSRRSLQEAVGVKLAYVCGSKLLLLLARADYGAKSLMDQSSLLGGSDRPSVCRKFKVEISSDRLV